MTGPKTVLFTTQNPALFVELQRQRPEVALAAIGTTIPALAPSGTIICFVDFVLPDLSGLEMCRRLRNNPVTKDALITMVFESADNQLQLRALQAGADDYVVGELTPQDILDRLEYPADVENSHMKDLIEVGNVIVEPEAYRVKYRGQRVNLAPNEFQLLLHFVKNPDRVFSREDLIELSGKPTDEIEARTVDVWVGRLRRAFKRVGAPEVVRTVRPIGYIFEAP